MASFQPSELQPSELQLIPPSKMRRSSAPPASLAYSLPSQLPPSQSPLSRSPLSQIPPTQLAPSQPSAAHFANQPASAATKREQYRQEPITPCADSEHDPTRKFSPFGIIAAIFLFPVGLIYLWVDSERRCSRCGVLLQKK